MEVVQFGGGWGEEPDEQRVMEPAAEGAPSPLVLVTWRDAWFDFDEPDPEDARADYLVETVGFLVRSGPRFVSVAQEILPDGDGFRAVTHIPTAVVETIAHLRPPGEPEAIDPLAR